MAELFINYRRIDTGLYVDRFAQLLTDFKLDPWYDTQGIEPGDRWAGEIRTALSECTTVLVLIGPKWITPRLDQPDDWVRREIELAKTMRKTVIPVLFDFKVQEFTASTALPATLHYLFDLQARSIEVNQLERQLTDFCAELTARRHAQKSPAPESKPARRADVADDRQPQRNVDATSNRRSQTTRFDAFRFHFMMMMAVLGVATVGAGIAQAKLTWLPTGFWLVPAGMLVSTCLFYLYTSTKFQLQSLEHA